MEFPCISYQYSLYHMNLFFWSSRHRVCLMTLSSFWLSGQQERGKCALAGLEQETGSELPS